MLKMEPGSVLIANNLLLRSCMPTMDGVIDASTSWASPAQLGDPANRGLVDLCPLLYMVQFMPDGATFDGARYSTYRFLSLPGDMFMSFPLSYALEREFPIVHNELDVE
ncbi:Hypothetical protein, putative [Bodo saltans]|uniref:Uncharacterized protein n=1 Tax=Bodo saltans TaxID=75058 RepID=A0A0S4JH50_BODSA|nr:Hypothetical protein, putative [Bodo saltans]|eukprot:CUG88778.1 Hypothetical protein, putative [Bodo saltans]